MALGVEKLAMVREKAGDIAVLKQQQDIADRLYKEAERARKFAQKIRAGETDEDEAKRTTC